MPRSSIRVPTTRFELPTQPSNNGIPGEAYDPTIYTIPLPGLRAGMIREGEGSGNALVHQSFDSFSLSLRIDVTSVSTSK